MKEDRIQTGDEPLSLIERDEVHAFFNSPSLIGKGGGTMQGNYGGSYEPESPSDFSYWAAALAFILASSYLYHQGNGLTLSLIGGGIAALLLGSLFNGAIKLIVFVFKISLFIGVLLGAVYLALQFLGK